MVHLSRESENSGAAHCLRCAHDLFLLDLGALACFELSQALDLGASVQDVWDILGEDILHEIDPDLCADLKAKLT